MQIVTVNNQVAIERNGAYSLIFVQHKRAVGHSQMMVVDKFLTLEIQFGQFSSLIEILVLSQGFSWRTPVQFPQLMD